jgi:hypothetical protein
MKQWRWQVGLSVSLIALSVALYLVHFAVFKDAHHIFIYLLGDIAFLPIEVLLVTLILDRLLSIQEKRSLMHKLNMVIGAFFSEVGRQLLELFLGFDSDPREVSSHLAIQKGWRARDFALAKKHLAHARCAVQSSRGDLQELKRFLQCKREFLLRLLENPNLLEHESFSNLLWAVFHLTEELCVRQALVALPGKDYEHLSGDIRRAYTLLVEEWVSYMTHLAADYPYLFSLALRTNPFDPKACVEIQG